MAAETATTEEPKRSGRLEQTNPDYDPNVVVETQNLTKVYRDFWGRQKVRCFECVGLGDSQG